MRMIWVAGARPNFMKVAPILRATAAFNSSPTRVGRGIEAILVHTGQHYDPLMSDVFFRDLGLPAPDFHLGASGGTHAEQTARVMVTFEALLHEVRPDAVAVVGDVNSTMACALVTAKSYVRPGGGTPSLLHVEAGLRSGDRLMPEEVNRVVTDSLSDILFTSEASGTANLLREGVPRDRIHFVGNVMIDSLLRERDSAASRAFLTEQGLAGPDRAVVPYGLVTLHRPSNVDDLGFLASVIEVLGQLGRRLPILFPMHPRTRSRADEGGLLGGLLTGPAVSSGVGLRVLPPLGYDLFAGLLAEAAFVVTDSGGVQEEATVFRVPCLTLRENTERPVTVEMGTNTLIGREPGRICREVGEILAGRGKRGAVPPLWDGRASERIMGVIATLL